MKLDELAVAKENYRRVESKSYAIYKLEMTFVAFVSAVITVGSKAACVLVQGPETKKAMTLMNARKV